MNLYLTQKQEDKIYQEVMEYFESKKGECTNCESNYIYDERNYFEMYSENGGFKVEFKTKSGGLLKSSLKITNL